MVPYPLGWMQDRAHSRVHTPPGPSSTDRCRELSDTICPRGCTDIYPIPLTGTETGRPETPPSTGRCWAREEGGEGGRG